MQSAKDDFNKVMTRYVEGVYTQSDVEQLFDGLKSDTEKSLLEDEMSKVWEGYADEEIKLTAYLLSLS